MSFKYPNIRSIVRIKLNKTNSKSLENYKNIFDSYIIR
jgi:hypothetical protein